MKIISIIIIFCGFCSSLSLGQELKKDERPQVVKIDRGSLYWLLGQSCQNGDEIGVKMLLKAGADVDGVTDYKLLEKTGFGIEPSWPINRAAGAGHGNIVKLLLANGARVDNPEGDGGGYTALTFAVNGGHLDIVKILLERGARKDIKSPSGTPIEIAKRKMFLGIVSLLE